MATDVLITGGAGSLRSQLAGELLEHGSRVPALDSFSPQVHGPLGERPQHLHRDVRDQATAQRTQGVSSVSPACRLALQVPEAVGHVFNIGSGHCYTVREVAERMAQTPDKAQLARQLTGKYRMGDIRHCQAGITLARHVLGEESGVMSKEGRVEPAGWLRQQAATDDLGKIGFVRRQGSDSGMLYAVASNLAEAGETSRAERRFPPNRKLITQRYDPDGKFERTTGWKPQVGVREGVKRLYDWLCASRGLKGEPLVDAHRMAEG